MDISTELASTLAARLPADLGELIRPYQEAERRAAARSQRIAEWVVRASERDLDGFCALLWADDWVRIAHHAALAPRDVRRIRRRFRRLDPAERREVLLAFLREMPA